MSGPGGHGAGRGFLLDTAVVAHQISAYAFLAAVVVLAVLIVQRERVSRGLRRGATVVVATGFVVVATAAAIVSGSLLPWDQLALFAVTTGVDIRGVDIRGVVDLPDSVRFVLIDGQAVARSTYTRSVWIHVLVIPVVLVAAAAVPVRTALARRRAAEGASANVPA